MEYQKITDLLGNITDKVSRFITKKWIEVHDQSGTTGNRYKPGEQIRFKTSMLRSDLCAYNDAYIVVKGDITVKRAHNRDRKNKSLAFKNNAPFVSCISKINGVLIENAKDLDIVTAMYNLIKCSKNYRKTTGSLWNYYRDEPNTDITKSPSFKDNNNLVEKTPNNDNGNNNVIEDMKIAVSLKNLSNFWRTLDISLINFEVSLTLTWSKNCVLTDITTTAAQGDNPAIAAPTGGTFKIEDTKLYVPVVT